VLQRVFRARTLIEVSDRFSDNRNGQFGFHTELVGSRLSPNKRMQASGRMTGLGRCICYLLTLPDPERSVGSAMNCPNPCAPPDKTAKSFQSASLSTTIAARLLGLSAIALGLVFALYGFVVGYEIMNDGLNILSSA